MYIHVCYIFLLGKKKPDLPSLYTHVVPKYAYRWRDLGVYLHFEYATLEIISSNCGSDAESCCKDLLRRWLKGTANPTWNELLSAIDNLPPQPINDPTVLKGI